mmetsp:Transcript_9734/g.14639  ORF Transcript_9734/g.14639 Transcript_9734/m.14639 type:complete len:790 (+) Transcript_9734:198-2567(+)
MSLESMKDIKVNRNSLILEPDSREHNFQLCAGEAASNVGSCCFQCGEEFDRTKRIMISSCQCGCQICSWCWEQVNRAHGSACPGCSIGGEPFPSTSYTESFSASYDAHSANNVFSVPRNGFFQQQRPRRCSDDYDPRGSEGEMPYLSHSHSEPQFSGHRQRSNSYTSVMAKNYSVSGGVSQNGTPNMKLASNRKAFQNLRVIQPNLVYVIGLHPNITNSEAESAQYFGQYGRIVKIVINNHFGVSEENPRHGSASAYVTFEYKEDAWSAIKSVDGFLLGGRQIHASFGTTKYCNSFLRDQTCENRDCLYLHELGDERDRFTKEQIQAGLSRLGSNFAYREEFGGCPSGTGLYSPRPVLPPPHEISRASTGRRAVSVDLGTSNNQCFTPKKSINCQFQSGGCFDWSPRIQSFSPHHDAYQMHETRQHRANTMGGGINEPRSMFLGLPPLNRTLDPSSYDERLHLYQRNKSVMALDGSHWNYSNGVQDSQRIDQFSRIITKSTRSLSDGNLGFDIDCACTGPMKSNMIESSSPSLGDMAKVAISKPMSSPSGHTPKTTPNAGGSALWSPSVKRGDSPRLTASFPAFSLGNQTPMNKANNQEPWDPVVGGGTKGVGQFGGIAGAISDANFKPRSLNGDDDRQGLPPPHPNKHFNRNSVLNSSVSSALSIELKANSASQWSDCTPARCGGINNDPSSPTLSQKKSPELSYLFRPCDAVVNSSPHSNRNSSGSPPDYGLSSLSAQLDKIATFNNDGSTKERNLSSEDREITPPIKFHKESIFDDCRRHTAELGL